MSRNLPTDNVAGLIHIIYKRGSHDCICKGMVHFQGLLGARFPKHCHGEALLEVGRCPGRRPLLGFWRSWLHLMRYQNRCLDACRWLRAIAVETIEAQRAEVQEIVRHKGKYESAMVQADRARENRLPLTACFVVLWANWLQNSPEKLIFDGTLHVIYTTSTV